MADQFNDSIPAVTNQITEDVADIAETLGYIKDVFQNFCYNWSNTVATQVFPNKMDDDDEVLINIAGSEVISVGATGFQVLGVSQGLDVTAALHTKIVEIGDWDMDAGATKAVAHGLTLSKIRDVEVVVRNDDDTAHYSHNGSLIILSIGASDVNLAHSDTGTGFDGTTFNATSYNRGWVIIHYVS
jgi:hypothetical protein